MSDPLLPRRPPRTSQREEPPKRFTVYSVRDLSTPGMTQAISVTEDSVHVRHTFAGCHSRGGFRFALGDELQILSAAVRRARTTRDKGTKRVGSFSLPSGATIEVGAGSGVVAMRWILPSGNKSKVTTIRGEELNALQRAAEDLAARAARFEGKEDR